MPIALADLLTEQQVILRLRSRKPANAIREIVDVLASDITGRKIAKPEAFLEQVFAREQSHPSVGENGVVFPKRAARRRAASYVGAQVSRPTQKTGLRAALCRYGNCRTEQKSARL